MSEPLPVVERITAAIATALATITKANGYQTDVSEIVRPKTPANYSPQSLTIQLAELEDKRATDHDTAGVPAGIGMTQTYAVDLLYSPSDNATVPLGQVCSVFLADARKCLGADYQWGGLVLDSRFDAGAERYYDAEHRMFGVRLKYEVDYRVAENDPYTQI